MTGISVRSATEIDRAQRAVEMAGTLYKVLDENVGTAGGYASICTMHLAKGVEFKTVLVMTCDDERIPS